MVLSVKVDFDDLKYPKRVVNAIRFEHKFIVAQALTATMRGVRTIPASQVRNVKSSLEKQSNQWLDRPKRPVQKGWFESESATKNNLSSGLNFKDRPFNTYRYLFPHIAGVKRKPKSFEKKLINHPLSSGGIPPGSMLVPSSDNFASPLKIDKYGNVTDKTVRHIYNNVATTERTGNRSSLKTRKTSSNPTFMIGKPKYSSRPAGVYWRRGENHKLVRIFTAVQSIDYRKKYRADETFKGIVRSMWAYNFDQSVRSAVNPLLF